MHSRQCLTLWRDGLNLIDDDAGGDRSLASLSKHESKTYYWTEGVPSVKKTGFGQTTAAEMVDAAAAAAVAAEMAAS